MSKPDGGAAFPQAVRKWDNDQMSWCVDSKGGMTLLDYFAGQALASGQCPHNSHEARARWCKNEAEALITKLKVRKED